MVRAMGVLRKTKNDDKIKVTSLYIYLVMPWTEIPKW